MPGVIEFPVPNSDNQPAKILRERVVGTGQLRCSGGHGGTLAAHPDQRRPGRSLGRHGGNTPYRPDDELLACACGCADVCVCTHGGATGVDGGLVGIRFGACAAIGLGAGSRDLDATVSPTAKRRLQSSRREAQDYCLRAQTT